MFLGVIFLRASVVLIDSLHLLQDGTETIVVEAAIVWLEGLKGAHTHLIH